MLLKQKAFLLIFFLGSFITLLGQTPYVILVSFDGFRWDYLDRGITPNLRQMEQQGVRALSLEPVYPSKTFPNHISTITGMYPSSHGIILNEFSNPSTGEWYRLSDKRATRKSKWYLGEAFWETAERQGVKTASYFWPGSAMDLEYRRPSYYYHYDHNRPYEQRVDGVLEWLQLPSSQRPHFITLYFHETDTKGHVFGPNSAEVNQAVARLDSMIGRLTKGLEAIGLKDSVNVIVTSDHGMTEISREKTINIEGLLRSFQCRYISGYGPFLFVIPEPAEEEAVYAQLKETQNHYRVYKRKEIPEHYHFSGNPFIPPILVDAEPGWSVLTDSLFRAEMGKTSSAKGNHGYDNHFLDLHGIFVASGPAFRKNYRCGTLRNIDIYPLLCQIFGIYPRSNIDGKADRISFVLKP